MKAHTDITFSVFFSVRQRKSFIHTLASSLLDEKLVASTSIAFTVEGMRTCLGLFTLLRFCCDTLLFY